MHRSHLNSTNTNISINSSELESSLKASRRSFILLLIFDLTFIPLIWLIYCTTKGYSLKEAYVNEIENYDIDTSLFDVAIISVIRFVVLNLFYTIFKVNHWIPIALVTFASSSFLISKVILFAIKGTHKLITDYLILIISFLIVWIHTWYLDVKVFSIARKEANLLGQVEDDRLLNPQSSRHPSRIYGSVNDARALLSEVASFYSPMDSPYDSENEDNQSSAFRISKKKSNQSDLINNANHKLMNNMDIKKINEYELLASDLINNVLKIYNDEANWKLEAEFELDKSVKEIVEKLNNSNNVELKKVCVYTKQFEKIGKVFKLESIVPSNEALLLRVLRDEVEENVKWNITVQSSKVVKQITNTLNIVHVCTFEQAGGLVAPRDFVNLSKYLFFENKHILAATACKTDDVPQLKTHVRGENGPTGYIFAPINENFCKITWILNVNLKGWLPQYLIDQSLSSVQKDFLFSLIKYLNTLK